MDFIEISSTKALWGLVKEKIHLIESRLNLKDLSESERLQLLGEHKALSNLLLSWLEASEIVMNGV